MKKLLSLIAVCFAVSMGFSPVAHAADSKADCAAEATEKKLAGAAKASFEKKCLANAAGGDKPAAKAEVSPAADKKAEAKPMAAASAKK